MLKTGIEAKEALINGINTIANAVKVTMGAEGKTVIIRNKMGFKPHVTKDGVTVAESIDLENEFEELGAKFIKESARRTVDLVGDGTTTATVITQDLINKGFEKLGDGYSHVDLREGMELGLQDIKIALKSLKKNVGEQEVFQIATVSANNDEEIGRLISDMYNKIGIDGTVDVQEGVTKDTKVSYVEGMSLDRGWSLPMFITENSTQTVELEDVYIMIIDGKINTVSEISETIRKIQTEGKALLIFAEDIDEGVMTMLVKSKLQGSLRISVSMNPDFGENRTNILEDLATFTGAKVFLPKFSNKIELGFAKKIISDRSRTVVIVEDANSKAIIERVDLIKNQIKETEDVANLSKLNKRLSNLQNTVAVVTVGGITGMEVKEKKDRIDDAVSAVKSALEGGFVSGGGSTLLFISRYKMRRKLKGGQKEGYNVIKSAIQKPFEQILINAGLEKSQFLPKITKYGKGVNVKTRKVENLLQKGIIDSAKVVEVSLENANSIACLILQTDCLIIDSGL
jgi:chaperonin GroEL